MNGTTIVRLVNDSPTHFQGWLRCNLDKQPPLLSGSTPNLNYVVGQWSGLDTYAIDVYTGLAPGESRTVDLATATPMDYHPQLGYHPWKESWGGVPVTVGGVPLKFRGAVENGAGFDGHWSGSVRGELHVDLFVTWYPDDQSWAPGEIILTGHAPAHPDQVKSYIPYDLRLRFGDADVFLPAREMNAPPMSAGDWLADAQSRMLPIALCWPRHGGNHDMVRAVVEQKIQVSGITKLLATGNPPLPVGFDATRWAREMLPDVVTHAHDWFNSRLDPATVSGATGAQGSQAPGVAGPVMASPLALGPVYLAALDGSWPMFHLEPDGDQLDWKAHPTLRMFYGRPNLRICDDNLGKTTQPTLADSHGHVGPDDQHLFDWHLWAALRNKGTAALQWHARAHAIHWLFRWVVTPPGNWLTANRGIGWMLYMASELYRGLADRELAEAVKARCHTIFNEMIAPMGIDGSWMSWMSDPRLGGLDMRAQPWQAAVLAGGCEYAGIVLAHPGMRSFAKHIAGRIIDLTYVQQGGRWTAKPVIRQDGGEVDYAAIGLRLGYYDFFGTPLCLFDLSDPRVVEIRAQYAQEATTWEQASWLPPVDVQ